MSRLIRGSLYYLFYISLLEETLFRGFIQSYLFGLKCNKYIIFIIGTLLFSLTYIIESFPQLIFCFVFHLMMCFNL
ncbi:MAG: CPBP family intramembrane metalloprotease [Bacilli bacterium]|nr:CPBP family intramembrane metalloprotease [Bacilli bacterium]